LTGIGWVKLGTLSDLPENGTSWAKTAVGRKAVTAAKSQAEPKLPFLTFFKPPANNYL